MDGSHRPQREHDGNERLKRTSSWRIRFSLRRLMLLVLLVSILCWFMPRWGQLLVQFRADKFLVPMGLATYGHSTKIGNLTTFDDAPTMEANGQRAVWISKSNCKHCHSGVPGLIAFPMRLQHQEDANTGSG